VLLGISTALTAYLGQHLTVAPLGLNAPSLEMLALLGFALSTLAGVMRARCLVAQLGAETLKAEAGQHAVWIKTALIKPESDRLVDATRGIVLTIPQAVAEVARLEDREQQAREHDKKWSARAERWYVARDAALASGVVLYFGAKLWASAIIPR
jgi:hypothetical protein